MDVRLLTIVFLRFYASFRATFIFSVTLIDYSMSSLFEEDDYYLKWEKHHSAFISYFSSLFKRSLLVDCTLTAEEKYIKAHRMVLMACSPYFEVSLLC